MRASHRSHKRAGYLWSLTVSRHGIFRYGRLFFHTATDNLLSVRASQFCMEVTDTLRSFLENGEDWERKATSLAGVSIIRLPRTKVRPASLAIEVNPNDDSGRPMKKKGVLVMSRKEFEAFRAIVTDPKLDSLITAMESVIPERKPGRKSSEERIEL
jgi:hypothetical protein